MFQLKPYFAPDFTQERFVSAPNAVLAPAPFDGVAPEQYHAMSIFPEYFKVNGQWLLAEESRMDCVAVLKKMEGFSKYPVYDYGQYSVGYGTRCPADKLDYYLEHTPVWTVTEKFYGQPYILCYLGNFGGNIRLSGNFHQASERIDDAFERGGDNFIGIGSTLEGFGINQFMFEYVFDKAWKTGLSDRQWVKNLASRRLGKRDLYAERAWNRLTDSVYIAGSFSSQTPLARASLS